MLTCRRQFLDDFLKSCKTYYVGYVLDIGGKKTSKRGTFRPPSTSDQWVYLNNDQSTSPDYLANAENLPFPNSSFNTFLMCEVIEHLPKPEQCLSEAARILKPGGYGIVTIPFLFPIHSDPFDYQRWTPTKIEEVFSNVGLEIIKITPMGGALAVILDILQIQLNELMRLSKYRRYILFKFLHLIKILLRRYWSSPNERITTGFAVIAKKAMSV